MSDLQAELRRLSGTTLASQGAANAWAGTSGLGLLGALNALAGTKGVGLNGVIRSITGSEDEARSALSGFSGGEAEEGFGEGDFGEGEFGA